MIFFSHLVSGKWFTYQHYNLVYIKHVIPHHTNNGIWKCFVCIWSTTAFSCSRCCSRFCYHVLLTMQWVLFRIDKHKPIVQSLFKYKIHSIKLLFVLDFLLMTISFGVSAFDFPLFSHFWTVSISLSSNICGSKMKYSRFSHPIVLNCGMYILSFCLSSNVRPYIHRSVKEN